MSGDVKDQGVEGGSLTAADLDRLAALHEAAAGKAYTFRKQLSEDGRRDLWAIDGAAFASDAEVMCAARNALPSLLALARRGLEAERFPAHCAFCGARSEATPRAAAEHIATCDKHPLKAAVEENALLRAEIARGLGTRCDAPDCALQPLVGLCWDHAVTPEAPFAAGESKLAAALAEVERLRGRLERATNFSWRNGAVWVVRPEDSTLWCAYEEDGSCGAALIGKYDSLDAAWSAAEAQAGQAAKQGGEGRA